MIILGIALAAVALLVLGYVAIGGSDSGEDSVSVSALGIDLTTTALVMFLAGAATLLVLLVGLWMIRWGVTRAARTRSEMQRLRRIEAEVEARQMAELSGAQAHTAPAPRTGGGQNRYAETYDDSPTDPRPPARDTVTPADETRVLQPFEREQAAGTTPPGSATAIDQDDVPAGATRRPGEAAAEQDSSRL